MIQTGWLNQKMSIASPNHTKIGDFTLVMFGTSDEVQGQEREIIAGKGT
jgi:hypothetical protein